MNRMDRLEALSRLLSGDLPADEAAAWRAKIAEDPAVRADWEAMRALPGALASLPIEPVPAPLGRKPASFRPALALAALLPIAAFALVYFWPSASQIELDAGTVTVEGRTEVDVPMGILLVDGTARVVVEPAPGSGRIPAAEDPMHPALSHGLAATAGAACSVAVLAGTATFLPADGGPELQIPAGQSREIGAPPSGSPPPPPKPVELPTTVPALQARVRDLEQQLAEATFTGRLTSGALEAVQGKPSPWPSNVPDAARPDAFRAKLTAWIAEHPTLSIAGVDCDEYPCVAMVSGPAAAEERQKTLESMQAALVGDAYGDDPSVMQMASVEDDGANPHAVYGIAIMPQEAMNPDAQETNTRLKWRMESLLQSQ